MSTLNILVYLVNKTVMPRTGPVAKVVLILLFNLTQSLRCSISFFLLLFFLAFV